jgi:hypothetical protein
MKLTTVLYLLISVSYALATDILPVCTYFIFI